MLEWDRSGGEEENSRFPAAAVMLCPWGVRRTQRDKQRDISSCLSRCWTAAGHVPVPLLVPLCMTHLLGGQGENGNGRVPDASRTSLGGMSPSRARVPHHTKRPPPPGISPRWRGREAASSACRVGGLNGGTPPPALFRGRRTLLRGRRTLSRGRRTLFCGIV
eukprot:gene16648-biopygen20306